MLRWPLCAGMCSPLPPAGPAWAEGGAQPDAGLVADRRAKRTATTTRYAGLDSKLDATERLYGKEVSDWLESMLVPYCLRGFLQKKQTPLNFGFLSDSRPTLSLLAKYTKFE